MPEARRAEVEVFREFLRIRSVSGEGPGGSYREAVDWLLRFCQRVGLDTSEVEPVPGKPILIATWRGTDATLPAVLLNSHYDVVPALTEHWTVDPWAASEVDGRLYGRGAQDMKSVCVQYLLAIERLKAAGNTVQRTVHLTFVPDEEIGGVDGMGKLLETPEFAALEPIAIALDEGLANPGEAFTAFYGERTPWWILVRATGPTGHGSRFIRDTAPQKLLRMAERALHFRAEQEAQLGHDTHGCKHGTAKKLGDVTTVNLTMLRTGVSQDGGRSFCLNVIPTEAEAGFDVRIPPSLKPADFESLLNKWCQEDGLSWQFAPWTRPLKEHFVTPADDSNPWWVIFNEALAKLGHAVEPEVFPAATDSRFLRQRGIPALGFSPMKKCPILLHEHDEYIPVQTFLDGIDVYTSLLPALAGRPALPSEAPGAGADAKRRRTEGAAA